MTSELTRLFERLISELPIGAASLNVYQLARNWGTVVELKPGNAEAASFGVHCNDSEVYNFSFGVRSYWEFPYERRYRYDEKGVVAEIEEMSRAVVAGNCEESGGRISITGRIYVGSYTYKTVTVPVFSLHRFGTRRYAPYAQDY